MFNIFKKLIKNQKIIPAINNDVRRLREDLSLALLILENQSYDLRDVKNLLFRNVFPSANLRIVTQHPVAYESVDHLFPRGVARDNTRSSSFVTALEKFFDGNKISVLDVGCAGGGMVFDFLKSGHLAVGVEGSDFARNSALGHWGTIPDYLFTADATKEFRIVLDGELMRFDLITAWEVLEHISEKDLVGFFTNVKSHLGVGGYLIASICTDDDFDPNTGAIWHVTVHPQKWWKEVFETNGMRVLEIPEVIKNQFPRGDKDSGFHFIAQVNSEF